MMLNIDFVLIHGMKDGVKKDYSEYLEVIMNVVLKEVFQLVLLKLHLKKNF